MTTCVLAKALLHYTFVCSNASLSKRSALNITWERTVVHKNRFGNKGDEMIRKGLKFHYGKEQTNRKYGKKGDGS